MPKFEGKSQLRQQEVGKHQPTDVPTTPAYDSTECGIKVVARSTNPGEPDLLAGALRSRGVAPNSAVSDKAGAVQYRAHLTN
ncbi:hypothetical protein QYH69_23930 [Paraburkholderia sp. SARCC-3016]|uniref:hypothetical protein n=1 Tax=Paraburkholderia sp. SARCC-3016 TaxID=3058611 RepID=UPI002807E91F|nr:hypothetical protein [Paraburkholderia sp. SARCC-3016]MDQ7980293.1 hypothetical protein [Paraburkholderia sp. SARCC-3016]